MGWWEDYLAWQNAQLAKGEQENGPLLSGEKPTLQGSWDNIKRRGKAVLDNPMGAAMSEFAPLLDKIGNAASIPASLLSGYAGGEDTNENLKNVFVRGKRRFLGDTLKDKYGAFNGPELNVQVGESPKFNMSPSNLGRIATNIAGDPLNIPTGGAGAASHAAMFMPRGGKYEALMRRLLRLNPEIDQQLLNGRDFPADLSKFPGGISDKMLHTTDRGTTVMFKPDNGSGYNANNQAAMESTLSPLVHIASRVAGAKKRPPLSFPVISDPYGPNDLAGPGVLQEFVPGAKDWSKFNVKPIIPQGYSPGMGWQPGPWNQWDPEIGKESVKFTLGASDQAKEDFARTAVAQLVPGIVDRTNSGNYIADAAGQMHPIDIGLGLRYDDIDPFREGIWGGVHNGWANSEAIPSPLAMAFRNNSRDRDLFNYYANDAADRLVDAGTQPYNEAIASWKNPMDALSMIEERLRQLKDPVHRRNIFDPKKIWIR